MVGNVEEKLTLSRRSLLATGVTASAALAGCSSNSSSEPTDGTEESTPTATDEPTSTPEQTSTPEPTETEDPAPSLAEFSYPAGASQDGINSSTLYSTHESTLTDVGTVTLEGEITNTFDNFEETTIGTYKLASGGISRTEEPGGQGPTETLWSPAGEQVAYVQMSSGFENQYRIDNRAPSPNDIVQLSRFDSLLAGAEWSDALEVVEESENNYAVKYESVGIADEQSLLELAFGEEVTDFTASVTVSSSGYVSEIAYDITIDQGDGTRGADVTMSVGSVGSTSVPEPQWASTAKSQGVRFSMAPTDDRTAVELEMVNGNDVPSGTRISLRDNQGRDETSLTEAVSTGDRLYVGLSDSGSLVVSTDGVPDSTRQLSSFTTASLRNQGLRLFRQTIDI